MDRFLDNECNPKQLSPLTLAFIGDCVYEMFVREYIVCRANQPVSKLHGSSVKMVNASFQAEAVNKIKDILTEEEADVLKRGRNAHTNHTPKNMSEGDYHYATGFEALFGYLYLCGRIDRLRELFYIVSKDEGD